jgi:hypothetical protein
MFRIGGVRRLLNCCDRNATDLIQAFWERDKHARRKSSAKPKSGRKSTTVEAEPAKKKRGRPSKGREDSPEEVKSEADSDAENKTKPEKRPKKALKGAAVKKKRVRSEDTDEVEVSLDDMTPMDKWMTLESWESLVDSVDALERDGDGKLIVFFSL